MTTVPERGVFAGLVQGTQDLVTVVAPLGSVPVLLSGAKDGTIAVWDVRQSTVAMTLVGCTRGEQEDNTVMVRAASHLQGCNWAWQPFKEYLKIVKVEGVLFETPAHSPRILGVCTHFVLVDCEGCLLPTREEAPESQHE